MSLRRISLRDFVIVRALELDLSHGFTVLTGETGAGKSILIDALQLALGARADAGAIRDKAPVVLWMRDIVDRFVMQVQGSARIRLPDGGRLRLAYSGRNGHPYTSLGRVLVEEEGIPPAQMTMDRLVARLKSDLAAAERLIARNRSFVFFRELTGDGPLGALNVPVRGRSSAAADPAFVPLGAPVWLDVDRAEANGLWIAQDTGGAIKGPQRADIFYGTGDAAGDAAGIVKDGGRMVVLLPIDRAFLMLPGG